MMSILWAPIIFVSGMVFGVWALRAVAVWTSSVLHDIEKFEEVR